MATIEDEYQMLKEPGMYQNTRTQEIVHILDIPMGATIRLLKPERFKLKEKEEKSE